MNKQEKPDDTAKELARKNIRLAIILGIVAFCFYAGFIYLYI